jgi:hypothetical protein
MDEPLRTWAVIVTIAQVIALVLGLRQAHRVGCWFISACPTTLLAFWLTGATSNRSWQFGHLDIAFLSLDITALLSSVVLIYRKGAPQVLFWSVWILNLLLCFGIVDLAFFFRLRF